MRHFEYLAVLGACVIGTLPLELALGARVWRRPRRLAVAVLPPLVVFVVWDLWATGSHQWSFNPAKTTSLHLPYDIPFEEVLFFVVIPVCALLTLETVRAMLGKRP